MATFLLRRDPNRPEDKNASGINGCLVTAANEAAARELAKSKVPTGETKVRDTWLAVQLTTDDLIAPFGPISWIEGSVLASGDFMRNGGPIG